MAPIPPHHLIIVLLSTASLLLLPTSTAQPVLDISGNPLRRGSQYYILPVIRGRGGGLTLAQRNCTCPLYVAQEAQEVQNGIRLRISPADTTARTIQVSADANFAFAGATICLQSTVWTLRSLPGSGGGNGTLYVATGGVAGNPGASTLNNWFRIDRYDGVSGFYKLVFCPGVCSFCRPRCGDVGVFVEGGRRWLGLGGSPFPVMFNKA